MGGANRHPPYPTYQYLTADPYIRTVPIHLIHLRPGDGLTFSGRTYHGVHALTHDRVALNFFFVPRWRKMEYTQASWYTKEAAASLERLALRQLWARSFSRLYDESGKGVIFM